MQLHTNAETREGGLEEGRGKRGLHDHAKPRSDGITTRHNACTENQKKHDGQSVVH
jgi:hypothetical protein